LVTPDLEKEKLIEKKEDEIESDLDLVGATAIEDKLQVDVGNMMPLPANMNRVS
jgi:magnesium-transporting ATPase (P-type)